MNASTQENHPLRNEPRSAGATRIMGVDTGLTRCGLSMIDMTANRKASFINVGIAGTAAAEPLDERILRIFTVTQTWLDTYQPDALAIERIFAQEQVNNIVMGIAVMYLHGEAELPGKRHMGAERFALETAGSLPRPEVVEPRLATTIFGFSRAMRSTSPSASSKGTSCHGL